MHNLTTIPRRNHRKFPGLRFQLRQPKPIRQRRQDKHVRIAVILLDCITRRHPKPLDLRMCSQLLRNAELHWTNKPELHSFAREQFHCLEQLRDTFPEIYLAKKQHSERSLSAK